MCSYSRYIDDFSAADARSRFPSILSDSRGTFCTVDGRGLKDKGTSPKEN